jgi:hypothetical protein
LSAEPDELARRTLDRHGQLDPDVPGENSDWNPHSLRDYLETMGFNVTVKKSKRHAMQGVMLCQR